MSIIIHAGDPDAITELTAKLQRLEEAQKRMKLANSIIRKHGDAALEHLVKAGYTEEAAAALLTPDHADRLGYPPWTLQNNGSEIRRIRKRITEIGAMAAHVTGETDYGGFTSGRDAEGNRVWFRFSGRPDPEIRNILKRSGFKWAPNRDRWQRQWTDNAVHAQTRLIRVLTGMLGKAA